MEITNWFLGSSGASFSTGRCARIRLNPLHSRKLFERFLSLTLNLMTQETVLCFFHCMCTNSGVYPHQNQNGAHLERSFTLLINNLQWVKLLQSWEGDPTRCLLVRKLHFTSALIAQVLFLQFHFESHVQRGWNDPPRVCIPWYLVQLVFSGLLPSRWRQQSHRRKLGAAIIIVNSMIKVKIIPREAENTHQRLKARYHSPYRGKEGASNVINSKVLEFYSWFNFAKCN